jgi:hypothetical protein
MRSCKITSMGILLFSKHTVVQCINGTDMNFSIMQIKGILSTKIVIFSYPKLLSFSVLTFIKWRLTPSYAAKDTIFWQKKTQSFRYQNCCRMTIFKSIHMAFYVNTSWACALFRNNKQHVVLGQKRKCQLVE